jgi:hypothetical protein
MSTATMLPARPYACTLIHSPFRVTKRTDLLLLLLVLGPMLQAPQPSCLAPAGNPDVT